MNRRTLLAHLPFLAALPALLPKLLTPPEPVQKYVSLRLDMGNGWSIHVPRAVVVSGGEARYVAAQTITLPAGTETIYPDDLRRLVETAEPPLRELSDMLARTKP
jgi:hypothetical protein